MASLSAWGNTCRISKEIEFDAGHRVPRHNGKCRNPHGHRYKVLVECIGPIISDPERADNGMLVDFGDLKTLMMEKIHDVLDHKFIVWEEDEPMLFSLSKLGDELDENTKEFCVVFPYVPTAENIARWCWIQLHDDITQRFGSELDLCEIVVWETPTSKAIYNG